MHNISNVYIYMCMYVVYMCYIYTHTYICMYVYHGSHKQAFNEEICKTWKPSGII